MPVFREVFDTNVQGLVQTFQPFLAAMVESAPGHAGRRGERGGLPWPARLGRVLGVEGRGRRVPRKPAGRVRGQGGRVVTICPGFIATPMTARNPYRMPFLLAPDKAARLIARAIERRRRFYVLPWQMAWGGPVAADHAAADLRTEPSRAQAASRGNSLTRREGIRRRRGAEEMGCPKRDGPLLEAVARNAGIWKTCAVKRRLPAARFGKHGFQMPVKDGPRRRRGPRPWRRPDPGRAASETYSRLWCVYVISASARADDELPPRVGRVAEVAATSSWRRRTRRTSGTPSVSITRSGPGTISRSAGKAAPRSIRRRPVSPGGRHQPARFAAGRPQFRAVRRAGPRDPARARARPGESARVDTPNGRSRSPVRAFIESRSRRPPALGDRGPRRRGHHRHGAAVSRSCPARARRWTGRHRNTRRCATALPPMASTPGAPIATVATIASASMHPYRGRWWAMPTLTNTARGNRRRSTARSGIPPMCARLGALSRRILDRSRRLGTDVGRRRALGIRAVSLRPLGAHPGSLGMVSRRLCRATGLGAGVGRLGRRTGLASRRPAGRCTAGCRWGGASPTNRTGTDVRTDAGHATTSPMR